MAALAAVVAVGPGPAPAHPGHGRESHPVNAARTTTGTGTGTRSRTRLRRVGSRTRRVSTRYRYPVRLRTYRRPLLQQVACASACSPGGMVQIGGARLASVTTVVFHGRRGTADDRRVVVRPAGDRRIEVQVPSGARSGPLSARTSRGVSSNRTRSLAISSSQAPLVTLPGNPSGAPAPSGSTVAGHVFPIQGSYNFGGAGGRFGTARGGRSHQGQDVSARCGTPLVAAHSGVVTWRRYQAAAAGHYLVIRGDGTGLDYVYMHMSAASPLSPGAQVTAGQQVGMVGNTGNSRGCHLHFELWTAPGWYSGGQALDPLPYLQAWAQGGSGPLPGAGAGTGDSSAPAGTPAGSVAAG